MSPPKARRHIYTVPFFTYYNQTKYLSFTTENMAMLRITFNYPNLKDVAEKIVLRSNQI